MTAFFTGTARKITLALTFAASFSALSSTSSFAFSAEAQEMCTGDAFRLCSSEIPNIPKITACMIKHRSDLSSGCRTRYGSGSGRQGPQGRRAVTRGEAPIAGQSLAARRCRRFPHPAAPTDTPIGRAVSAFFAAF